MTPFKEYLEKNSWVLNSHSDTKVITTETLGEWALLERQKIYNKLLQEKDQCTVHVLAARHNVFHEIAVACLGKKEVKKRLEELNK